MIEDTEKLDEIKELYLTPEMLKITTTSGFTLRIPRKVIDNLILQIRIDTNTIKQRFNCGKG